MRRQILAGFLLLGAGRLGGVLAYNLEHGPFPEGAGLETIRIEEMPVVQRRYDEGPDGMIRFVDPLDANVQLLADGDGTGLHVELRSGDQTLVPRTKVSDLFFFLGVQAYVGDLNADGQRDYLLYGYSGGCGLAVGFCDVGFLLSGPDGHRLTTVRTLFPDEQDYVILNGKPAFIQTSFFGEEECLDGKEHNFWIYNLLHIDGAGLRLRNSLYQGFPRIIWYSFRPNHEETTLLSEAQKARLLELSHDEMFPRYSSSWPEMATEAACTEYAPLPVSYEPRVTEDEEPK